MFFRTHSWDAFVARQAEALRAICKGCDFYILADETRQRYATPGFVKFSHQNGDFESLGLHPYFDTNLLWYNGDYPLYLISRTFANLDYITMVEFDVKTDVNLVDVMADCFAEEVDVVLHNLHPAEFDWPWLSSCAESYAQVWRGLITVLVVSRRAVEYLLSRRRHLTRGFQAGRIAQLPYCEGFVPSEIVQSGFLRHRDLADFGDTNHFEFWPPYLEGNYVPTAARHFVHPYLDEARFIPNRLRYEKQPGNFLKEHSPLRDDLSGCSRLAVLDALLALAERCGDYQACRALEHERCVAAGR